MSEPCGGFVWAGELGRNELQFVTWETCESCEQQKHRSVWKLTFLRKNMLEPETTDDLIEVFREWIRIIERDAK